MTHLRRYLEEHGVLYPEQLAEAVRRQQIYGGSLDTVLLELELVDPVTLGEMLERACGFPVVPHALLENGLDRPWTEIPEDMQRSRWVEPLAREGDEIVVAVHPDLPNDQLGKLLRSVRRLRPMVTPECCLEKVAAERHQSVVPQRYAVLCAAYLSAVRRRPSMSGMYEVREDEPPTLPTAATPEPAQPAATPPRVSSRAVTTPYVPVVRAPVGAVPPVRFPPPPESAPEELPAVAGSIVVEEPVPMSLPGPSMTPPEDAVVAVAPPAPIVPAPRDEADVLRRLEQARAVLEASRSRDDALEAIAAAAMVLSPRVGLFRSRGDELIGLSTPHSAIEELGGKIVAASPGSAAWIAVEEGSFSGLAPEADLRLATGASATTPCVLQRVEVRGRPVVFVYLDRDGAPIAAQDVEWLGELAALAGRVFEEILKLRRQPDRPPAAAPEPSTTGALGHPAGPGWGVASTRVRAAYGDGSGDEPIEPAPAEPPPSRVSTPAIEHPDGRVPPPPLVPPVVPAQTPASWRLTPELAARALEQQVKIEPAPTEAIEAPKAETVVTEPEPAAPEPEPPPLEPDAPLEIPEPAVPEGEPSTPEPEAPEVPEPSTPEAPPETDGQDQDQAWRRSTSDDITVVGLRPVPPPPAEVEPSQRPTIELPALDDEIPRAFTRDTQELVSAPSAPDEPAGEPPPRPRSSLSKITMHSSPPPPPLPPPPTSAVDDEEPESPGQSQGESRSRRARSPTIHGLPPPELTPRAGATKRMAPRSDDLLLGPDEDQEVTIISLAAPIMPATARGRIELEDEDWVAPGSQLASDSQQGLIDAVIDAVVSGDVSVDRLREHGDSGLLRLMAQFPGPLEVLRRDLRALPPPSAHGPVIRTVISMGAPVVPHLIDLFEHPNPDVRFYAAFVFHELRDARCMRPLAKLAFDTNGDVRIVSMRVLETYRRAEGFDAAASIVREQLASESRSQQLHSARAAGTLRDVGGIVQLIELLSSSDRFIQEAALESLCSITGQQHGLKPHRWRAWHDEHGKRHRVEWIIDSLRHRDLPVRRWAADELVRITGQRVPFSPMGDKRARDIAAKAWTDWWDARGRELFGG